MTVIALDIGGTGSRAAIRGATNAVVSGPGIALTDGHAEYGPALDALATQLPAEPVSVVALGATGLLARANPGAVAVEVRRRWSADAVVVASDGITALCGAWGTDGGAVVSAGTGVVALAGDFDQTWVRADGWGPWIGDRGGGAWIGARALDAAMRGLDHRRGGSRRLLDAAAARFGEPTGIPALLRRADSTAALLAGFVPDVAAALREGDAVAEQIVSEAAVHLADAGIAVLAAPVPQRIALVGGITAIGAALTSAWAGAVVAHRPGVETAVDSGTSLDGSVRLAERAATGGIRARPPYLSVFTR